jgi:hypothetical protein
MRSSNSNISLIYGSSIFLTILFGMGASFLANKVYPMTGGESKDTGALGLGPGTPPEPKEELVSSPDAPKIKLAKGTAPLTSPELFDTPVPESRPGSSAIADDDVKEGGGLEYGSDTDSEEDEEDSEEELPVMTGGGNQTWINPHGGFTLPNNNSGLAYQF